MSNYNSDTVLNSDVYKKVYNEITSCCKLIKGVSNPSRQLNIMASRFPYRHTFKTKGVQGITGLMECNKVSVRTNEFDHFPLVFKIPIEIDKTVEHEYSILSHLNNLREFCPHFVTTYGMYELPISRSYVYANRPDDTDDESSEEDEDDYKPEDTKLFMDDKEYLPTNVLFIEYISGLSLDDLCRKANKTLINSQLIGALAGLSIAQDKYRFTHYDIHIDNILIRECEPEALFVYHLNDSNRETYSFVLPTYGFYPVIIDMGNSYISQLEGKTMNTTVENYDNGLQSNIYDPLNDLHHLLISAMHYVQYDCEEFYFLSTRLMYLFRHIKIRRKKGWKCLPNNIHRLTRKRIEQVCSYYVHPVSNDKKKREEDIKNKIKRPIKGLASIPVWLELDIDLVEILSLGIFLPWKKDIDPELKKEVDPDNLLDYDELIDKCIDYSVVPFFREIQKLYDMSLFEDVNDFLFMVKEIVQIVSDNTSVINQKMSKQTSKRLMNDIKKKIIPMFRDSIHRLNWDATLFHCKYICSILGSLYYTYVEPHVDIINEAYTKTEVKSPIDLIRMFRQNTAMRVSYTNKTILYVWDAVKEKKNRIELSKLFTQKEIEELNDLPPKQSEKIVLSMLQK